VLWGCSFIFALPLYRSFDNLQGNGLTAIALPLCLSVLLPYNRLSLQPGTSIDRFAKALSWSGCAFVVSGIYLIPVILTTVDPSWQLAVPLAATSTH
jgi:hypothetical protein